LGREFFHFDADASTLMGSDTGITIGLGQRVTVKLASATPETGGVELEMLTLDGQALPKSGKSYGNRGNPAKRKLVNSKRKADKVKRKVKRTR
jgi:ribonuclease R